MASLALGLLAAPDALAGSYTATGSGGTNPATVTPAADCTYTSPQDAAATASMSPMGNSGGPTYTIQISPGTLTDTFTWVPASGQTLTTDPPPACVLVQQNSSAVWYVKQENGTGSGSGTAVCGLPPGATVTPGTYNAPNPSFALSATLYSVKTSPGASFSVSCSPTASFTGQTGSAGLVSGEAEVGGGASVSPVTITLTGTLMSSSTNLPILDGSGNQQILIGQQCTAGLSGIPSACTVSNYSWTVSGSTFQSWVANNNSSRFTANPNPNTAVSPSWYWYDLKQATETVTCTATVTPPTGQGAAFPITVTQKVVVWVPIWSCKGIAGTMQVNTAFGGGNGTDSYLYAGPIGNTGRGMDWQATISPPASPAPITFGAGVLEIVQTETPNETYTSTAGTVYNRSNNGQTGLDSSYAYPWLSTPLPPNYESGDSPNFDLTSHSAASAQLASGFTDWLMYEPPNSSQFVPVANYSWATNKSSTGPVTPAGTTPFTPSNAFPSWTQNVGNGTFTWVAAKQ